MPTYEYFCEGCGDITDGFFKLAEVRPTDLPCKSCGEAAQYRLSSPLVLKASFLDGQRSRAWKDVREASKLNLAAAGTDNLQEKAEINKEVKKIGYNFTKDDV